MKSKCLECHKSFVVKPGTWGKFCSRSCSASFNNRKYPKRVKQQRYCSCGGKVEGDARWCAKCLPDRLGTGNFAYRKDELAIKRTLERKYRSLHKERIGRRYIDFANNKVLIEHSKDGTHGLQDIIARFRDVEIQGDSRTRVAFVDTRLLGPKRRKRLMDLGVHIKDYRTLLPHSSIGRAQDFDS